jgi:hypothetical protein
LERSRTQSGSGNWFIFYNPLSLFEQVRAQAPEPVQRTPCHIPIEDVNLSEDDYYSYTLREKAKTRKETMMTGMMIPQTLWSAGALLCVNTSGKASSQILHLLLGDDSSPLGDNAAGR